MDDQATIPTWLRGAFQKSIALRQAQQAVMLDDLAQGLKIERDNERALSKYHSMPSADGEEDDTAIHLGDINVTNPAPPGGQSQRRTPAVVSAMKYLAIVAGIVSGGWTVTSLAPIVLQAIAGRAVERSPGSVPSPPSSVVPKPSPTAPVSPPARVPEGVREGGAPDPPPANQAPSVGSWKDFDLKAIDD